MTQRTNVFSLLLLSLLLHSATCSSTNIHANANANAKIDTNANDNHLETTSRALPSFPLKPTALLHAAHTNQRADGKKNDLHPHISAVYIGLDYLDHHNHDPEDKSNSFIHDHNNNIRRFNEDRKFSRFEHARNRRTKEDNRNKDNQSQQQETGDGSESATAVMEVASFDTFQTAPLSQGIGTHYATVWVGSPVPQPQTLIVDTGSHHTAFPCKPCRNCGAEYHANSFFDPSKSDSFEMLKCGQCTEDVNRSCHGDQQCTVSQSYAEGSSWRAIQVKDIFTCGYNHPSKLLLSKELEAGAQDQLQGYDSSRLSSQFSIPFTFGCQNRLTGLFTSQLADGIMGMSATEFTLTKQLFNEKKIEHKMFSMCFRKIPKQDKDGVTAGVLTIGGVDTSLQRSPMVYAASNTGNSHGWFIVHVKKIWLRKGGGISAKATFVEGEGKPVYRLVTDDAERLNSGRGVIVDSGTTDTYLSRFLAPTFRKIWLEMTGMAYSNHGKKLTREEVLKMPTILVQMTAYQDGLDASVNADDVVGLAGTNLSMDSPRDILLAIPATHYMEYSISNDNYTPRIYLSESTGGTLGANAMMNHDVLFDWENARLGFSESNCDYDELVEGVEVLEGEGEDAAVVDLSDGVSKDCVLGESTLELSCIETLHIAICVEGGEDSNDHILPGTTKTTILIEEEGFGDGKDCVTVGNEMCKAKGMGTSSNIDCDDAGFCTITNQCSMTCEKALHIVDISAKKDGNKETGVDEEDSNVNRTRACPDENWSSCQHSCEQSRITSKLGPDGECLVSKVETRICHIDNCGRSDPCRVPFVVHAILLFASVDASDWTKQDEDMLVESFATAVNAERESGDELFSPGDIKITSVSKWNAVDDEFYSGNVKTGMKISLEVSIYNDKAIMPSKTNAENNNGTKSILDKGKDLVHVVIGPERAVCKESDTYPLSHTALNVHLELEKSDFMAMVIANIRGFGREILGNSAFAPLRDEGESVDQSTILTSWTVKNEVSDFFQNGTFQGFNKDTVTSHVALVAGVLLILLCVCYCGVCFGTHFTRRKFRLEEAKNTILRRMQETRQDRVRGEYAQVGSNQDEGEGLGELEMGNLENFEDDPTEDVEELEFTDASEKISRLK